MDSARSGFLDSLLVPWEMVQGRTLRRCVVLAVTCVLFGTISMDAAKGASAGPDGRRQFAPRVTSLAGSNWAGYIAEGAPGGFSTASADWVVPDVSCPSQHDLYAPWVGIDGDGDSTVEQTGVETTCSSGSPMSIAWYEMFPSLPVYFKNPVSTGDAISGSVSYSTSTKKFEITITDVTKGWTRSVTKARRGAPRLSAEAVIEAPGSVRNYPKIPAVNFTDVLFNGQDLTTFDPVTSKSGSPVVYGPGPITNGADFTIAPTN